MGAASAVRIRTDGGLRKFLSAPVSKRHAAYLDLVALLWDEKPASQAAAAVPGIIDALAHARDDENAAALLAVLLGLLAESGDDPGEFAAATRSAVRDGLDRYLDLLAGERPGPPLTLALLYLVAHFGEDRDQVLGTARGCGLSVDDYSRLERCLRPGDLGNVGAGRQWPSPAAWALRDDETERDNAVMSHVPDEYAIRLWENDTRLLLAYSGAKALGAIGGPLASDQVESVPPALDTPIGPPVGDVFAGYGEIFRCPECAGQLAQSGVAINCVGCAASFSWADGYLDLPANIDMGMRAYKVNDAVNVARYEKGLRPAFVRIMGRDWAGAVTADVERRYLEDHLDPASGPVLDLGAGTGRWTQMLTGLVGPGRVIALDLSGPRLSHFCRAFPDVLAVRGNALRMPFSDNSLGSVNCWNALQTLPAHEKIITEVGRCLQPGGTFTLMTFQLSDDPIYRFFQRRHEQPLMVDLADPAFLRTWLEAAGMTVTDETTRGTYLFMTATC
jgi:SAM-dependent methyltransferase